MGSPESIDRSLVDGPYVAKYFKFCHQRANQTLAFNVPFRRVGALGFYAEHKKAFDLIPKVCFKLGIDVFDYIRFFIGPFGKSEQNIDSLLVNEMALRSYVDHLQEISRRKKVMKWFMKSAEFIASECAKDAQMTTKDFIRRLIQEKKLATYYMSGKISRYWFSGIPGFSKLVSKLDQMSRDEFKDLVDKFEIYNSEINEAFLKFYKTHANPIRFTDDLIFKKRSESMRSK